MLTGTRILVTGATGQVARPIAEQLNASNEVWAAARFRDEAARAELEAQGIGTAPFKLGDRDLDGLPDVDYVIHCAANTMPPTTDKGIEANAIGTGWLMERYADATAFFHMSSSSVYRAKADLSEPYTEDDELGGYSTYSPHYAMSKLMGEGVARFQSHALGLPTIIGRLNVAYGSCGHGGLPNVIYQFMKNGMAYEHVAGQPNYCSPIHEDDIVEQVSGLVQAAEVGAPAVNLGGDEPTTIEEIIAEVESLTGLSMTFNPSGNTMWDTQILDATKRTELVGPTKVGWRDGARRCLDAHGAFAD